VTKLPLDLRSPLSAGDGTPIRQGIRTAAFAEQVVVHASQVARIPREVAFGRRPWSLVAPERFRTARQFWSYSGLGIMMRSSSDWAREGERWVRA
jgi:hypothetical protein